MLATSIHVYAEFHKDLITLRGSGLVTVDRWTYRQMARCMDSTINKICNNPQNPQYVTIHKKMTILLWHLTFDLNNNNGNLAYDLSNNRDYTGPFG